MKKYIVIKYDTPKLIIFDCSIEHFDIDKHFEVISAGLFIKDGDTLIVMHGSTSLNIKRDDIRGIVDEGLLRDFYKI